MDTQTANPHPAAALSVPDPNVLELFATPGLRADRVTYQTWLPLSGNAHELVLQAQACADARRVSHRRTPQVRGRKTFRYGREQSARSHPAAQDQRGRPARDAGAFTHEVLRYEGPVLLTLVPHFSTDPLTLTGTTLPPSSDVRPVFATANRDPKHAPMPLPAALDTSL